ncbi:MAG: DUF4199 domain-containing protein [Bacteroidota bacterium]|nr:DUF4199 domain-containing protein [Bacteroidota bacterium]MDP3144956.1 DUF4199 domain-containing protein [Bacteroidota bacterium]
MKNTENIYSSTTENIGKSNNSISIKTGIYCGLGLVFYFIVMRLLNLHQVIELHYFNIVVLFFGLRYAIKHIISKNGEIRYFEGLKSGVIVTLISIFMFNLFMILYETIIDPSFLSFLSENIVSGHLFSTQQIIISVFGILTIEGLSSGFILTFMLMQFYKAESSSTK